jgi:hypothetical protein
MWWHETCPGQVLALGLKGLVESMLGTKEGWFQPGVHAFSIEMAPLQGAARGNNGPAHPLPVLPSSPTQSGW